VYTPLTPVAPEEKHTKKKVTERFEYVDAGAALKLLTGICRMIDVISFRIYKKNQVTERFSFVGAGEALKLLTDNTDFVVRFVFGCMYCFWRIHFDNCKCIHTYIFSMCCKCIHTYLYMSITVNVYVYIYVYTCIYLYIYIYLYMHTYICQEL